MKRFNHGIKWTLAAVLLAGVTAAPVMAEKTTPATGKTRRCRPCRARFRI